MSTQDWLNGLWLLADYLFIAACYWVFVGYPLLWLSRRRRNG